MHFARPPKHLAPSATLSADPTDQRTAPVMPPSEDTPPTEAIPSFELEEITLTQLAEGMDTGRWTAESITRLYLERIEALDRQGPTLRSVIETNPDAIEVARQLDEERQAQGPRSPLHGVPILLKDNIATADGMTTTAGSLALEGSIPAGDAFIAARLREAGAILLGKANMSEWANFRSPHSSSGWSARGGQCRNPYALDRNPCGSSSGSGVAVSANLAAAAIGTETNGSVICPSSKSGLVGIKPTVGLLSRSGIIPISHSQDTAGPMARTVADAAALLGAMTGLDTTDPATAASEDHAHADYTEFLDPTALRGARIGVSRDHFGPHPAADQLIETAIETMAAQGAEIVDPVAIANLEEMEKHSFQVMLYEFKADLNAYLAALGPNAPVSSLAEVIAFNEQHPDLELPYFGQEHMLMAQAKGGLSEPAYLEAVAAAQRLAGPEGIDRTMEEHRLDAIIAPSGGPAWLTDHVNGDHHGGSSSSPAAIAGYPNITVPAGFIRGLPVGLSLFAHAWSEPKLIALAHAYEQATHHRRPPRFLPTADLEA